MDYRVLHELLCVSFPHRMQSFRNRLFLVLPINLFQHELLSVGPQVLPEACFCVGFPQDHIIFWASPRSSVGSSLGYRWISTPSWTLHGLQGSSCFTVVCTRGCREISACEAPPAPPSSLTWYLLSSFSHILSLHSSLAAGFFPPLLNTVSQR